MTEQFTQCDQCGAYVGDNGVSMTRSKYDLQLPLPNGWRVDIDFIYREGTVCPDCVYEYFEEQAGGDDE